MVRMNLRRLFAKKDFASLVEHMTGKGGMPFALEDTVGNRIVGEPEPEWGSVPLVVGDQTLGTIHAGDCIENIRALMIFLIRQERDKKYVTRECLDKQREVTLLHDISERIASSLDPYEVGKHLTEKLKQLLHSDNVCVILLSAEEGEPEVLSFLGAQPFAQRRGLPEAALMGAVLATGTPEIVNDIRRDYRFIAASDEAAISIMCAPLKVKNRPIGVILVSSTDPHTYTAGDLMILSTLASHAASAIDNALLYKNLEIKIAERTNELYNAYSQLNRELGKAADYVRTLLPEPEQGDRLAVDWRFVPSASLGGDAFGYSWLDDDRFVFYLLDVCGHGIDAALFSISVLNSMRSRILLDADPGSPCEVLTALNRAFPMARQNDMYFTMWYGVYDSAKKTLRYASAGHPPALLYNADLPPGHRPLPLQTPNLFIGGVEDFPFQEAAIVLDDVPRRLYVFSDGVVEIQKSNGEMWEFEEFEQLLARSVPKRESHLDRLYKHVQKLQWSDTLRDDFTILEIVFP